MQPSLDHNNMQTEQIQSWNIAAVLFGLFNAAYNSVMDLTLNDWVAIIGLLGMVVSLLMQRHYNRRRDVREQEKHEWERPKDGRRR